VHELGITQGIIDRAREAAESAGARRVTDLFITMAPTADFTQDSIEMYFEMLAGDDPLFAGAELHFEPVDVGARCLECGTEFSAGAPGPTCPACASRAVRLDPQAPMVQLTDVGIDDEYAGDGESAGGQEEESGGA
jgi:Zn finger protein HypA/HybF involved in hydrogenase expression